MKRSTARPNAMQKKTFSTMLQWVIAYKETLALYLWT